VLRDVAHGLNILHHLNPPLIHQDIKPENIYIDVNWHGKIGDFGHARDENNTDPLCGTPPYLDPQACIGYKRNTKMDIWAFGIMLYEMFTRKNAYEHAKNLEDLFFYIETSRQIPFRPSPDDQTFAALEELKRANVLEAARSLNLKTAKKIGNPAKIEEAEKDLQKIKSEKADLKDEIKYLEGVASKARLLGRWCCMYERANRPSAAQLVEELNQSPNKISHRLAKS
jgi:serine/threonine protein kinase